jgi:hypothetical protein
MCTNCSGSSLIPYASVMSHDLLIMWVVRRFGSILGIGRKELRPSPGGRVNGRAKYCFAL